MLKKDESSFNLDCSQFSKAPLGLLELITQLLVLSLLLVLVMKPHALWQDHQGWEHWEAEKPLTLSNPQCNSCNYLCLCYFMRLIHRPEE